MTIHINVSLRSVLIGVLLMLSLLAAADVRAEGEDETLTTEEKIANLSERVLALEEYVAYLLDNIGDGHTTHYLCVPRFPYANPIFGPRHIWEEMKVVTDAPYIVPTTWQFTNSKGEIVSVDSVPVSFQSRYLWFTGTTAATRRCGEPHYPFIKESDGSPYN